MGGVNNKQMIKREDFNKLSEAILSLQTMQSVVNSQLPLLISQVAELQKKVEVDEASSLIGNCYKTKNTQYFKVREFMGMGDYVCVVVSSDKNMIAHNSCLTIRYIETAVRVPIEEFNEFVNGVLEKVGLY
jgi:hypothetical protein